jgi:hypothetical protein
MVESTLRLNQASNKVSVGVEAIALIADRILEKKLKDSIRDS